MIEHAELSMQLEERQCWLSPSQLSCDQRSAGPDRTREFRVVRDLLPPLRPADMGHNLIGSSELVLSDNHV